VVENIQHCRRYISIVMDDLPRSGFAAIDIGDAMLEGDLLSRKVYLPALVTPS